ncbi:MAG TPA: 2-oxoacid:acceptor oxidoreductase family protein [Bacillota bacterium]|nr:2-oxoacid:acceptor oxidoreductase family protein [Bacillota bacterium]HOA15306.1 2-oxoacid:acceptor oxidoreductase family protein [Bacillota bacterium]HOG53720.1 2-oxoacid:acceptor oxidoreductase family protein [Bacillota bacterium]
MAKLVEIRWHSRAGQGAKTAALTLAEAAIESGKYAQAFPEYGPERMGAPMQAFNRISDEEITVHSNVQEPSIVVILDQTLIGATNVSVTGGVPENGTFIVNTQLPSAEIRKKLGVGKAAKVYTIDATQISIDTIGRFMPNTPMIGALVKATGLLDWDLVIQETRNKLAKKFSKDVIDKNVLAMERAYKEVRS